MTAPAIRADALKDSVLVVAHPDDEILWFGSVAPDVGQIIICFLHDPLHPDLANARSRALEDHPLADKITCLELTETNSFGHAKWPLPRINKFGLKVKGSMSIRRSYRRCARDMREALEPIVHSAKNFITHNPWGEYGHEEHVMVYRVISELAKKSGSGVWYNNYVSSWSEQLARRYLYDPREASFGAEIDCAFMQEIAEVYRRHDAWTWFGDYVWFASEYMIGERSPMSPSPKLGRTLPMNFIGLPEREPATKARKSAFIRKVRRIVRRITKPGTHND